MIIVKISGGLGNQLFQYSFGRYLGLQLGAEVRYDIRTIMNRPGFTNRDYGLSAFDIVTEAATRDEIRRLKRFTGRFSERAWRKAVEKMPSLSRSFLVESRKLPAPAWSDECYYDGYWQYYRYAEKAGIRFREEVTKHIESGGCTRELAARIRSTESGSIHIRRGDYISNPANAKLYAECDAAYYERAAGFIEGQCNVQAWYVFSDDVEWARDALPGKNCIFIEDNSAVTDMFLMSCCRHNIIANSTFSWWAAWLNPNPGKIVVAPQHWYNGRMNEMTRELIPEEWIRL